MKARLTNASLFKANSGTGGVKLLFKNEANETISWTGWLSEKTRDNTIKKLIELDFMGDDLHDLSFPTSEIFGDVPEITLGNVETNENGYMEAGWVNTPKSQKERITKEQSVTEFAGLDFKGELIRLRQDNPNLLPADAHDNGGF